MFVGSHYTREGAGWQEEVRSSGMPDRLGWGVAVSRIELYPDPGGMGKKLGGNNIGIGMGTVDRETVTRRARPMRAGAALEGRLL
jgi:hypothetical protein